MTKKIIDSDWSKLSDSTSTILERLDINRKSYNIQIGEEIDIPYFKGIFTEEIAKEIVEYQHSKENKGYYAATIEDGILKFKFLKRAF